METCRQETLMRRYPDVPSLEHSPSDNCLLWNSPKYKKTTNKNYPWIIPAWQLPPVQLTHMKFPPGQLPPELFPPANYLWIASPWAITPHKIVPRAITSWNFAPRTYFLEDTRMTSSTSSWCLYCQLWTFFCCQCFYCWTWAHTCLLGLMNITAQSWEFSNQGTAFLLFEKNVV